VVAGQLHQAGRPARGGHVTLAVGEGHVRVAARMQAEHRHRGRHRGDRVRQPVLPRPFIRAAAHQVERRGPADPLPRAVGQREHPRLGDDPGQGDAAAARAGRARRIRRQGRPARRPGGELPAGAVADRDDVPGVGWQLAEQVDAGGDVREGGRPAAARAGPPVFQVPGGVAAGRQVGRERLAEGEVVTRPPESPVDDHHGAPRGPVRLPQFTELSRVGSVMVQGRRCHEAPA
jgi:hypothetical protein